MRRALFIVIVMALAWLPASPTSATAPPSCVWHGVMTFSPSLPKDSNPMKVPTVVTLVGAVIPSQNCPLTGASRMKWQTGHSSGSNCTTFVHKETFPRGTGTRTWTFRANGSRSTATGHVLFVGPDPVSNSKYMLERLAGNGWALDGSLDATWPTDGSCHTKGLSKLAYNARLDLFVD